MDLDTTPALEPPEDLESNFVNPPTLMAGVIITSTLTIVLSSLFVAARAFVRTYLLPGHHVEDWLSYFAWVGLMTYTGILVYIENFGFARHQWDISMSQLTHIMYYINILYCIYGPTTLVAKLSVLFQIKRIFTTNKRDLVYWIVITSITLNIICYTGLFFSYVFQCWPRERIWSPQVPGRCVDATSSNLAAGILNLISDIETLILPAWAIWHLNLPLKRKLGAYAVFSVGFIACIIGIIGIYLRILVLNGDDFTWLCTKAALLVVSEIAVVIIVGCMPSLPRLYHHIRNDFGLVANLRTRQIFQSPGASGKNMRSPKRPNMMNNSIAKYLGPVSSSGVTALFSRASAEEHVELRTQVADIERGARSKGDSQDG